MTSYQKTMLLLSRLPRGVRLTSLGRINRPLADLQADIRTIRCSFFEVHAADGSVRGFAPQDLAALREASENSGQSAFLVAFTAEQHASLSLSDPRPNLYAVLEADEEMSSSPAHQPRFLPPSALLERLHAYGNGGLHPDDYAHRLAEIDAAIASAPDAVTAGRIQKFRASAAKYLAATADKVPEGKFYTTDRSVLAEDATRMPCEVVSCPAVEEPSIAAPSHSVVLPRDENAPLPRNLPEQKPTAAEAVAAKPARSGQFTLAL